MLVRNGGRKLADLPMFFNHTYSTVIETSLRSYPTVWGRCEEVPSRVTGTHAQVQGRGNCCL